MRFGQIVGPWQKPLTADYVLLSTVKFGKTRDGYIRVGSAVNNEQINSRTGTHCDLENWENRKVGNGILPPPPPNARSVTILPGYSASHQFALRDQPTFSQDIAWQLFILERAPNFRADTYRLKSKFCWSFSLLACGAILEEVNTQRVQWNFVQPLLW
ncbi:hypothetical protein ACROYT_G015185 [Oculina patagonica]